MLALRSAPPAFGTAEAERIGRDVYGLAGTAESLSGERDCNFHLRGAGDFVLKIMDGAAQPHATDCQLRVLQHLAEQDPSLPVPRMVAAQSGEFLGRVSRDGRTYATCLLTYLHGTLLARAEPSAALLRNLGSTLARIDRALQGFFHPALGLRIAWDVRRLPELLDSAAPLDAALKRLLENISRVLSDRLPVLRGLRSQAVHGDCHPGNLLVDPAADAVCGVLDFGDMIHAPSILEPAVTLSELLTSGLCVPDQLVAVLQGYAAVRPFEQDELSVLYDLVAARHAVTLLVHAWRSRNDPAGARLLADAAQRAWASLEQLSDLGRDRLTDQWREAVGPRLGGWLGGVLGGADLARRRRLMGSGAELFYEQPLHLVRGEGVWLYDPQGGAYLDAYNNVPHVGHCHPEVVGAIQRQTATLVTHTRYLHEGILDYAEELTSRCPPTLDACIFVNSGSEANDVAWRMAQFATGRRGGVIMAHAYHGITDAVAALTPGPGQPLDPRVVTLAPPVVLAQDDPFSDAQIAAAMADTEAAIGSLAARGAAPAAFFLDSALTSSGIYDPPAAWSTAVIARLRAAGCLIVADEVQYGLGRSGSHFWGFERRGMQSQFAPDIVTLGKPVGNGYPMGVVIANRGLIEAFQAKSGFFSTFGGGPVAAAAGLAVLRVIDRERLCANAARTGAYLRERLQELARRHECLGRVRGSGLLLGLEVRAVESRPAGLLTRDIVNQMARQRVLIGHEGPHADILKLRPPLPFRAEHADRLIEALAAAMPGQPIRRSSSGMT